MSVGFRNGLSLYSYPKMKNSSDYIIVYFSFIHSFINLIINGAMGHWIDPSWGEPIELFLIPASAP